MSSSTVSLPAKGTFVSSVRESTAKLVASQHIQINPSTIRPFLSSISHPDYIRLSQDHGHTLPLSFSSPTEELNLLSILSLLNFGSSFRAPLHAFHKRGVFDTIRFFVVSCFISEEDHLSARGMERITEGEVASLLGGLPLMVERDHPDLPGVTVGEQGGRLRELVLMVKGVMNQTGRILVEGGWDSLGAFVVGLLESARKEDVRGDEAMAEYLVGGLVEAFPAFRDMYLIDRQPVYLFKKAFFLVHSVCLRFTSSDSNPFPTLPSNTTTFLPTFADNVIPSLCLLLNLVELPSTSSILSKFPAIPAAASNPLLKPFSPSESNDETPPKGGPELTTEEATILRASTVYGLKACVEYVQAGGMDDVEGCGWMKDGLSETGLDGFVWAGGKDRKDWRRLERFVADSIYY